MTQLTSQGFTRTRLDERLTGEPASSDRSLGARFTALTYQSLAVFDGEADGGPPRSRLHPNGEALMPCGRR